MSTSLIMAWISSLDTLSNPDSTSASASSATSICLLPGGRARRCCQIMAGRYSRGNVEVAEPRDASGALLVRSPVHPLRISLDTITQRTRVSECQHHNGGCCHRLRQRRRHCGQTARRPSYTRCTVRTQVAQCAAIEIATEAVSSPSSSTNHQKRTGWRDRAVNGVAAPGASPRPTVQTALLR